MTGQCKGEAEKEQDWRKCKEKEKWEKHSFRRERNRKGIVSSTVFRSSGKTSICILKYLFCSGQLEELYAQAVGCIRSWKGQLAATERILQEAASRIGDASRVAPRPPNSTSMLEVTGWIEKLVLHGESNSSRTQHTSLHQRHSGQQFPRSISYRHRASLAGSGQRAQYRHKIRCAWLRCLQDTMDPRAAKPLVRVFMLTTAEHPVLFLCKHHLFTAFLQSALPGRSVQHAGGSCTAR